MKISVYEKNGKWFYSYREDNRIVERVCRYCKSKSDAEDYVNNLSFLSCSPYLIKNIANDMFVEGGEHLNRLRQFGRNIVDKTIYMKRSYIEMIIAQFGTYDIRKIKVSEIENRLLKDKKHSGSWKNQYLEAFSDIYSETTFVCPQQVLKPQFLRFARNSKKADIFTTEELKKLLSREVWPNESIYFMYCLIAVCGLRLGEARGIRARQFMRDEKMLIVDGFCRNYNERTNYNKKGSNENRKIRVVPVPEKVFNLVTSFIDRKRIKNDEFVFLTPEGNIFRSDSARYFFYKAIGKAGIIKNGRKLVPHSLRYTYVTLMRGQLDVQTVQKMVGHTESEMTEYYTRFNVDELVESLKDTKPYVNYVFD